MLTRFRKMQVKYKYMIILPVITRACRFFRFLLYGLHPASTTKLHRDSPLNPSRFRHIVASHWAQIIQSKSTSTEVDYHGNASSAHVKRRSSTFDTNLTSDIISFVCTNELVDLELFRKAITRQVSSSFISFVTLTKTSLFF